MRTERLAWFGLTVAGAILIALPDSGPRILSFSGEHGPSLVDACGALLLLAGFGVLIAGIIRGRRLVLQHLNASPRLLASCAFIAGLGLGLLTAGVFTDFWWWWLVGALALQAFWLLLWRLAE